MSKPKILFGKTMPMAGCRILHYRGAYMEPIGDRIALTILFREPDFELGFLISATEAKSFAEGLLECAKDSAGGRDVKTITSGGEK